MTVFRFHKTVALVGLYPQVKACWVLEYVPMCRISKYVHADVGGSVV